MRAPLAALALWVLLCAAPADAANASDTLLGAHALLAKLPPPADKSPSVLSVFASRLAKADAPSAADTKLKADIAAFAEKMPNDKHAAEHWAELFERAFALRHTDAANESWSGITPYKVLDVLPPPRHWPRIAAILRTAHQPKKGSDASIADLAVLTFADKLAGDIQNLKARKAQFDAAEARSGKRNDEESWTAALAPEFERILAANGTDDPVARFADRLGAPPRDDFDDLLVPDLVTLAGEERARALLLEALTRSKSQLDIAVGDATRALAVKLALANVDRLAVAQWRLVRGLDCAPLYEALQRKFDAPKATSALSLLFSAVGVDASDMNQDFTGKFERAKARVHYFAALIAHDRGADAERLAQDFSGDFSDHELGKVLDALAHAGYTKQVYAFLEGFLDRHPAAGFWGRYFEFAARTGQQQAMLAHVRAGLVAPQSKGFAATLRAHLVDALLAADMVDEGVAELDALLADPLAPRELRADYGLKLAELGRLYEKPDWIEGGLAADATRTAVTSSAGKDSTLLRAHFLVVLHRYAEAESLLANALERWRRWQNGEFSSFGRNNLSTLAALYHAAGRDGEVLVLLDEAPDWGVADLDQLLNQDASHARTVGVAAANALHGRGDDARALAILETVIDRFGGADPAYELYTKLRGQDAIAFLDAAYARDPFEERPLIWKAVLQLKAQQLDAAERTVRAAIAVDPSDGEEGPGDRLRAYAVLADIIEARGNVADAAVYRNAVQAIRESEHADEFRLAGLHTRAIAMYGKALERFAEAYCIQSRLAVELNASGNTLLAQEHYRRAYELMPGSFGRLESHCLGCENVFGGDTAQGIAEKVFADFAQKSPRNPQVHYLLGYLREQQERYAEALTQYQTAAQLDADYLNAWKHQREIDGHIDLPAADRDRVRLRLLELDPRARHAFNDVSEVVDWPALYTIAAKAFARQVRGPATLYPLPQSKRSSSDQEWAQHSAASPGGVIAQTRLMSALGVMM